MGAKTHSATTRYGGNNTDGRTVNVDVSTVVRIIVAGVITSSTADRANRGGRSGRVIARVAVGVTSSDSDEVTVADETVCGIIDGLRVWTTKTHVDNDAVGAVAVARVSRDIIHGGNNVRV